MHRTILLPLIAALMLTACASGTQPTQMPSLLPPGSEMQQCEALPLLQSGRMQDLLANHIAVAQAYHQCRDRHQGLVQWLEATDALR
jgi:uncharacterized lipoprotein YmbA